MSSIGENIAKRRKESNMTQDQLAEKVGMSAQAISKWENDLNEPDIRMLMKLADLFGVSVDDLIRGVKTPVPAEEGSATCERVVRLDFTYDETHAVYRIPGRLILDNDIYCKEGFAPGIPFEPIYYPTKEMLRNNVVGTIADIDTGEFHIIVTVE